MKREEQTIGSGLSLPNIVQKEEAVPEKRRPVPATWLERVFAYFKNG
jgi:hypothetical protein